jgi:hypothetical protein
MDSSARAREEAEQAQIMREMLYSRDERARLMAVWRRKMADAKREGYTRMPYDPPLSFPEPLAGMRRHPATGHIMADQPRNSAF